MAREDEEGEGGGVAGCFAEGLSSFMIRSILRKRIYWTAALMLIGACVLPVRRLVCRKNTSASGN